MAAAAKHLTPVTLELGGKSPCIVDETANLTLAARRITCGKFLNAGPTCVAPDYVIVHQSVKEQFVRLVAESIRKFYGEDPSKARTIHAYTWSTRPFLLVELTRVDLEVTMANTALILLLFSGFFRIIMHKPVRYC
jgi:hypothetical protein